MDQNKFHFLFEYRDGHLYWRQSKGRAKAGSKAGYINKFLGREYVRVEGKRYFTHRIVFAMFHGELPEYVDHIDNNPLNNKIENLRKVDASQSQWNTRKQKNNTSGMKGVSYHKKSRAWRVRVSAKNREYCLGYFKDIDDAMRVAVEARKNIHGVYAKD